MNTNEIFLKMTLKEKIAQLTQIQLHKDNYEAVCEFVENEAVGSIIVAANLTAGNADRTVITIEQINHLQKLAMKKHGIPILFGHDVIHGHHICWPIPLALSAAFNPELVEKSYEYIAEEAKTDGINWSFAPMLDVSRDPRWGRIIEGPGEDPYLGEKMAEAVVKGFQGKGDAINIAACAKHYIGYGASEGGRDYHKTEISDYTLRNFYLRAFISAVRSGVATVMNSFNEISGQPTASSKYLLTDVLRGELGFDGFVVSDWAAITQLVRQGVAEDDKDAARLSINAGLDMDMTDNCYYNYLEELVKENKVDIETVDISVKRILDIKEKMKLFEQPYFEKTEYSREKHRESAKEAARESIVLLKNENNVLPLNKNSSVCVMGDMSLDKRAVLGSWVLDFDIEETVTIYDGIKSSCENCFYFDYSIPKDATMDDIAQTDTIIVVLGESDKITGEANSISKIELTEHQEFIIKSAKKSGKKVVGVLAFGRPRALENVIDDFDAILYVWHGGSQIGNAVAEVVFGDFSPCGRLPVTMPRTTGQIPIYYNCPPSGREEDGYYDKNLWKPNYWDVDSSPLYPFGYGLAYTDFEYSNIISNSTEMTLEDIEAGKSFEVSVKVKNIGTVASKEVVQMYIRDCVSSMTRPIKELKGFDKIMLAPGEEKSVSFKIGFEELAFYNQCGKITIEKGAFKIFIGENCLTDKGIIISVI